MRSLWLSRRIAPIALVTLLSAGFSYAQDEKKAPPAPADKPAADPAETPDVDPFKVPEENDPKVLQGFLGRVIKTKSEKRSLTGQREHFRKVEGAVKTVEEKALDEETALIVATIRTQLFEILQELGDETAVADRQKWVEALLKSKHPKVVDLGTFFSLASRIAGVGEVKAEVRQKLIDDAAAYVRAGELTEERLTMAEALGQRLAGLGDYELAAKAQESMASALESRKIEQLAETVERLRAGGRRYGLPGKPMKVQGKTLDGKDFELASLKGKVVLVDFWATWCGPCIAEMPHVREMYEGYHGKGFDVVGISLDEKKEVLASFLAEEKIPWTTLYSESEGNTKWSNPTAVYYGVNSIPTAILIGPDGNVVSLDARGRELTKQLERLLGAPEKKPETPKEDAPKN